MSRIARTRTADDEGDRAPRALWLMAAAVGVLRFLPFLATRLAPSGDALVRLPLGYNPKDFLAYVAFVREAVESGPLLADPFTTAPQAGRFILLFHSALGWISGLFGLDPFWTLELSRFPLVLAFLVLFWRVSRPFLADRSARLWACGLAAFGGGFDALAVSLTSSAQEPLRTRISQNLGLLVGWNFFGASHNPLWLAGLLVAFWALGPVVSRGGPAGAADALRVAAGTFVAYLVHPYSAIVVVAVFAALPLAARLAGENVSGRTWATGAATLVVAGVSLGLLAAWQRGDVVFREASAGLFGPQAVSPFWYPVALGAVGVLAARGLVRNEPLERGVRVALAGWIGAVALLHSSPLLNGYHFVFFLWPPLCLAAAPVARDAFSAFRGPAARVGFLVLVFVSCPLTTLLSVRDALEYSGVPQAAVDVVGRLASLPVGNVLSPPEIGVLVPALTHHRVWAGQWFLTPRYAEKSALFRALMTDPARRAELQALLEREGIRYLILPSDAPDFVRATLATRYAEILRRDGLELWVLREGPGHQEN